LAREVDVELPEDLDALSDAAPLVLPLSFPDLEEASRLLLMLGEAV
jgi:hypothetical protein